MHTRTAHTRIARTVVLIGTAALALLAGCSADPERDRLEGYWSELGEGGQQTLCTGLAVKGEDWLAEQIGSEHEAEAVAFFVGACEDVDLPRLDASGFGIPL